MLLYFSMLFVGALSSGSCSFVSQFGFIQDLNVVYLGDDSGNKGMKKDTEKKVNSVLLSKFLWCVTVTQRY